MNNDLKALATAVELLGRDFWLRLQGLLTTTNPNSGARCTLLWNVDRLQIERVSHVAGGVTPMHRHPNVDTLEFPLCGAGMLYLNKRSILLDETNNPPFKPLFISRNCWHGGAAVDQRGGSFLSVQYWYIDHFGSIGDDWEVPNNDCRGKTVYE